MGDPYIEIPELKMPYIAIPTREPRLWGMTKILLYIAMALMFLALVLISETLGSISILIFSFLFIYSEDFRRIVRAY